jgi:transcriptional regulator with XRE-family HTH domain
MGTQLASCDIVCVLLNSSDLIYSARKRARLTQAELARRLSVPQSQVSRWERGTVTPSFERLQAVVRACGLELTMGLANRDDTYSLFVARSLAQSPADRIADAVDRQRDYDAIAAAACA